MSEGYDKQRPQVARQLEAHEIEEMELRAKEWLANPELMHEWLRERSAVLIQVIPTLVLTPGPGRNAVQTQANLLTRFIELAEKVIGMNEKKPAPEAPIEGEQA